MGGAILAVVGETRKEVEQRLKAKRKEALHLGLYEEARTPIEFDPVSQQYRALLKVHS